MKSSGRKMAAALAVLAILFAAGCAKGSGPEGSGQSTDAEVSKTSSSTAATKPAPPQVNVEAIAPVELHFPMTNTQLPLNEICGVTHAGGKYALTKKPYLYEGAERILNDIGTRLIKLWMTKQTVGEAYAFHSDWPYCNTLTELAQTDYFKNVFAMPFRTFILEAHPLGAGEYWEDGMDDAEYQAVSDELYAFTKYLLTTYQGTGKIFVLQNWEGDNMLGENSGEQRQQGLVAWLNARQDGINRARKEVGMNKVYVFGAVEVNKISSQWNGKRLIDGLLQQTGADLYSYSNWETKDDAALLTANLNQLAAAVPDSTYFGSKNIMIGEFGTPENSWPKRGLDQAYITQVQCETALKWGCQFVAYWQLYCNEFAGSYIEKPINDDMKGYWLVRPDGTANETYDYIKGLMAVSNVSKLG